MSRRRRGYFGTSHRARYRHVPEIDPRPRCRQCKTVLITEQDQEIGFCYDCWGKISSMTADEILAFRTQRFRR